MVDLGPGGSRAGSPRCPIAVDRHHFALARRITPLFFPRGFGLLMGISTFPTSGLSHTRMVAMSVFEEIRPDLPTRGVAEVADLFDVSESTVRRWVANGDIGYCRIGGLVRFTASDIANFIRRSRVEVTAS